MQCSVIDLRRDSRQREERFRLGGEGKPPSVSIDVDGLDPKTVAADQKPPAPRIPEGETEHAVQPLDEIIAVPRIAVKDDFAVRAGLEALAPRLQLAPQLAEVVDL